MTTRQQSDRVDALAQRLAQAVTNQEMDLVSSRFVGLYPAIWRILAGGRAASSAEIAASTGRFVAEVADIIAATPQAEVDRDGQVLGAGLTLLPTPHRVLLPGRAHQLYVWCVPDAFVVSRLLRQPLRLISPCHATGRDISLDVERDEVRSVDPPGAALAFVTDFDLSDARGTVCVHQNLFADTDAATPWLEGHSEAFVVPAADGYRVMAPLADQMAARSEGCTPAAR